MSEYHDFKERLAFSEGIQPGGAVMGAVMQMVPGANRVRRASTNEDKSGTDFWVDRDHGLPPLSIDMKNRGFCPIAKYKSDDACIETTSVYRGTGPNYQDEHRHKIGWTLDAAKRTDYIVYTWPANNGVRYWIVPFPPLCSAALRYWREWARKYKEREARNKTYLTLSVYPPRSVIASAMREFMVGTTLDSPAQAATLFS